MGVWRLLDIHEVETVVRQDFAKDLEVWGGERFPVRPPSTARQPSSTSTRRVDFTETTHDFVSVEIVVLQLGSCMMQERHC